MKKILYVSPNSNIKKAPDGWDLVVWKYMANPDDWVASYSVEDDTAKEERVKRTLTRIHEEH